MPNDVVMSDSASMENLASNFFKDMYTTNLDVQPEIITDLLQR
jgi:hypothetical protein